MRPNTDTQISTSGTLVGEDVRMTFDANSIQHLMDVLTELYSNPALAVIREYATNALDSHRAAGNDDPIEIILPTDFEPQFIVRDYGVGLSVDDLRDIYSKYGLSTKRDTDAETGMLGLGCKSGLAYCSTFTIDAVRDGKHTRAIVSRKDDGTGNIRIVSITDTDDPNGVTITVPVSNVSEFRDEAERFFRFWHDGDVLVNGNEPDTIEGVWLDDDTLVTQDTDECYVVMGGVPYRAHKHDGYWRTNNLCSDLPREYHVIAYVPMGAVNFPPNRESLQFTDRTNKVLDTIREGLKHKLRQAAQDAISQAASPAEAFRVMCDWKPLTRGGNFIFDSKPVPESFRTLGAYIWTPGSYGRSKTKSIARIDYTAAPKAVQVVGFDLANVTTSHRRKLRRYLEQNHPDIDMNTREFKALFTPERIAHPWVIDNIVLDYETDIKPIKLTSKTSGGTGGPTTYGVWDGSEWTEGAVDDIEGDDVIVYSPAMTRQKSRGDTVLSIKIVQKVFPDAVLVEAGENSWDKLKREVDNVRDIREAIKTATREFIDTLTDEQRFVLTASAFAYNSLTGLDPDRIEDDDLAEAVRKVKAIGKHRDTRDKWTRLRNLHYQIDLHAPSIDSTDIEAEIQAAIDQYPLVKHADTKNREAIYEYVEAVAEHRE